MSTVKNATYRLARLATGFAVGFLTFMLVFGTLLPIAVLITTWFKEYFICAK